jgi:hypothetical protein
MNIISVVLEKDKKMKKSLSLFAVKTVKNKDDEENPPFSRVSRYHFSR